MNDVSRLGGTMPPSLSTRPDSWRRSWFVNFAGGFVLSAMFFSSIPYVDFESHPVYLLAVAAIAIAAEILVVNFWPGFRTRRFFQVLGAAAGLAVAMAFVIVPVCGWNSDPCRPAVVHHQVQRHAK